MSWPARWSRVWRRGARAATGGECTVGRSGQRSLARCRPALGTYVRVLLRGEEAEDTFLDHSLAAFAEIERIEKIMSFHDPHSELSRLNREAHQRSVSVCPEMVEVLEFGLRLSRLTGGRFDFTVAPELVERGALPDHGTLADPQATWRDVCLAGNWVRFERPLLIDLGGIAKGYAVDRAMSVLPAHLEAVVNAGGDLSMRPWKGRRVGIRVPGKGRGTKLLEVPMGARAVATSGSYLGDQGSTIICPLHRRPLEDPRSVSVFAPTCMHADALTKVALAFSEVHPLWQQMAATPVIVDKNARQVRLRSR